MTCKVPHPSYSGLETFPTAASDSDRGPVTASLEPGHHQGGGLPLTQTEWMFLDISM